MAGEEGPLLLLLLLLLVLVLVLEAFVGGGTGNEEGMNRTNEQGRNRT